MPQLDELIENVLREMKRPRAVCICDDFREGEPHPYMDWVKCANCGGWMSGIRALEHRVHNDD